MLFASIADAGPVILFVLSGVALLITSLFVIAYAAHCYLIVAQATTAGLDRVDWPDDPIVDWLYQSIHVVGIVLIWLIPAGLLSRGLSRDFLPDQAALRFLIFAVPGLWLFFPIGFLSSMASLSRWVPLSGAVIGRLCRIFPSTLLFYLITALLFAAASGLAFLGIFTEAWYTLPFAAIAGSAVMLIHARLVGRIAWLMSRLENKKSTKKKARTVANKKRAARPPRALATSDPWAVPEEQPEEEGESYSAPSYRIVETTEEEPKPPRPSYLDPEPEPYTMADPGPETADALPTPKLELEKSQIEREVKLREREPTNPPPAMPLFSGVYSFPLYSGTLKAWIWLTCSGLAVGGIARFMLAVSPFK